MVLECFMIFLSLGDWKISNNAMYLIGSIAVAANLGHIG